MLAVKGMHVIYLSTLGGSDNQCILSRAAPVEDRIAAKSALESMTILLIILRRVLLIVNLLPYFPAGFDQFIQRDSPGP